MDDLISRQEAIDAVGNMLRRKFGIGGDLANITLAGLPSADAVQVTRCKDCKHLLIVTNEPLMGLCQLSAPKTLTMWSEDIATHFCGWGERKDDDGMDS